VATAGTEKASVATSILKMIGDRFFIASLLCVIYNTLPVINSVSFFIGSSDKEWHFYIFPICGFMCINDTGMHVYSNRAYVVICPIQN